MSDHDAASVVGQMAGLGAPAPGRTTPGQLIARFATSSHTGEDGVAVHCGFCGLTVIGNRDPMVSGFDDGYAFLGFLEGRGWRGLSEKGDWPYVVYVRWQPTDGGGGAIVEYCEGDFTLWQFPTAGAAKVLYDSLREAP